MSTDPTARSLPSDTSMSSALASQRNASGYDCTPCRLMGSATFVGLGAYTYYSGMKQLQQADIQQQILKSGSRFGLGVRKASVLGLSMACAGLGMYRLVN